MSDVPDSTPIKAKPPKAPPGLGREGRALWRSLVVAYVFDLRETVVVEQACRQADLVVALDKVIADDGLIAVGANGQARLHGAVTEVRQARLALTRLLGSLDLPADDAEAGTRPTTASSRKASRAADTRWARVRLAQEQAAAQVGGDA